MNRLGRFQLSAAQQLGDDLSGDAIGGDDFECGCDEIEGLHYEWDHNKPAGPPSTPAASEKEGAT